MDSRIPPQRRHLVAVWFADIVEFSHLASAHEDDAVRLVEAFHACVVKEVAHHEGRVVKYIGDAALAEFHSTDLAAHAACALIDSFAERTGARLRVGLHVGEVAVVDDDDLLGDVVNLAARLQVEAQPGEVIVSEDAWRQLRQREGFRFEEAGRRRLRGQPEAVKVYRVCLADAPRASTDSSGGRGARESTGADTVLRRLSRRVRIGGLRLAAVAVLIGIAAVLIFSVGLDGKWPPERADAGARRSPDLDPARLAVLYFEDHSPDGGLRHVANSLTEALIHELTQVEALTVVSQNGVRPFSERNVPRDSVVRALRVGSIVEGSVAQSGDRVRVRVQLVDASSGATLRSSVIEQRDLDPFALEDSVVSMVGTALRQELGREIQLRAIERSTQNRQAYELYMHAQMAAEEFKRLRATDVEAAARALLRTDSLLARAEALDPTWVEPIVRRGWSMYELSRMRSRLPGHLDDVWSRRALEHAERAVRLGGAPAYELRGVVRLGIASDLEGEQRRIMLAQAEADLRRALGIDSQRAVAWVKLSDLLVGQARFPEAVFAAEQALAADAFLADAQETLHQIYYSALQLGPSDEAARACAEGRRRFPRSGLFILCRLFVLASFPQVAPDLPQARALVDSLRAVVAPDELQDLSALGNMLAAEVAARAGDRQQAEALIRRSHEYSSDYSYAYYEAHARLLLGERDEAVQLLSRYLSVRPDTAYLAQDWWFTNLHDHSSFLALLGRHARGSPQ